MLDAARVSGGILRSEYLDSYRNTRKNIYRGVNYKTAAAEKEAAGIAGLWLSSKMIAAYRFAVRFEFSRVI